MVGLSRKGHRNISPGPGLCARTVIRLRLDMAILKTHKPPARFRSQQQVDHTKQSEARMVQGLPENQA